MDNFLTSELLGTYMGLSVATSLIVQFTKSFFKKRYEDYVVRIYTFIISVILSIIFIPHKNTTKEFALLVLNSIIITMMSIGGYEVIKDPKAQKKLIINNTENNNQQ